MTQPLVLFDNSWCRRFLCSVLAVMVAAGGFIMPPSVYARPPAAIKAAGIFSVPPQFGSIQSLVNDPQIILIQDAHAVPDAQESIQNLIEHFQNTYGIRDVGVEGTAFQLDAQIFRSFPDQKIKRSIFGDYMRNGELTGVNAAAIFSPHDSIYRGVEDWNLYLNGLRLFSRAELKEASLLGKTLGQKLELQNQKKQFYSEVLLKVDQALESFYSGESGFEQAFEALAEVQMPQKDSELGLLLQEICAESRTDFDNEVRNTAREVYEKKGAGSAIFNRKYQEYQTSQLSSAEFATWLEENFSWIRFSNTAVKRITYQKRLRDLEGAQILEEFEAYGHAVKDGLFENSRQRDLDTKSREIYLSDRLARLELNREEWNEIKNKKLYFGQDWQPAVDFYENAELREAAMTKNVSKSSGKKILVVGGFHTRGIAARLEAKKISYAIVTPKISHLPELANYRAQMRGEVSWRTYFEVKNGRLNLYEAFLKAARDRLLENASKNTLKNWRDAIIVDLAAAKRITKANQYTRFLDQVAKPEHPEWFHRIESFARGLKNLEAQGKMTEPDVLRLFESAGIPAREPSNALAPHAFARSESRSKRKFTDPRWDLENREETQGILHQAVLTAKSLPVDSSDRKRVVNTIVDLTRGLIYEIAWKWLRRYPNVFSGNTDKKKVENFLDDLAGEGVKGIYRAIEKFDPSFNAKFSTYAYGWIQAYIRDYFLRTVYPTLPDQYRRELWGFYALRKAYAEIKGEGPLYLKVKGHMQDSSDGREMLKLIGLEIVMEKFKPSDEDKPQTGSNDEPEKKSRGRLRLEKKIDYFQKKFNQFVEYYPLFESPGYLSESSGDIPLDQLAVIPEQEGDSTLAFNEAIEHLRQILSPEDLEFFLSAVQEGTDGLSSSDLARYETIRSRAAGELQSASPESLAEQLVLAISADIDLSAVIETGKSLTESPRSSRSLRRLMFDYWSSLKVSEQKKLESTFSKQEKNFWKLNGSRHHETLDQLSRRYKRKNLTREQARQFFARIGAKMLLFARADVNGPESDEAALLGAYYYLLDKKTEGVTRLLKLMNAGKGRTGGPVGWINALIERRQAEGENLQNFGLGKSANRILRDFLTQERERRQIEGPKKSSSELRVAAFGATSALKEKIDPGDGWFSLMKNTGSRRFLPALFAAAEIVENKEKVERIKSGGNIFETLHDLNRAVVIEHPFSVLPDEDYFERARDAVLAGRNLVIRISLPSVLIKSAEQKFSRLRRRSDGIEVRLDKLKSELVVYNSRLDFPQAPQKKSDVVIAPENFFTDKQLLASNGYEQQPTDLLLAGIALGVDPLSERTLRVIEPFRPRYYRPKGRVELQEFTSALASKLQDYRASLLSSIAA